MYNYIKRETRECYHLSNRSAFEPIVFTANIKHNKVITRARRSYNAEEVIDCITNDVIFAGSDDELGFDEISDDE